MRTSPRLLAEAADGRRCRDRPARRHVERCLRCQAELAQYRKLLRALHTLRTEVLEPAPGPARRDPGQPRGGGRAPRRPLAARRAAGWPTSGGIAAATAAAGAAGAIVLATAPGAPLAG